MKVVINSDYGGFSLSDKAIRDYAQRKGITLVEKENRFGNTFFVNSEADENYFNDREIPRNDITLVAVVESLKDEANGFCASLKVVEIPEGVDWYIEEYDGNEWVAEKHRTWM